MSAIGRGSTATSSAPACAPEGGFTLLFTMLTMLTFRYPSGREPALIPALRSWLSGWPGIGRIAVCQRFEPGFPARRA